MGIHHKLTPLQKKDINRLQVYYKKKIATSNKDNKYTNQCLYALWALSHIIKNKGYTFGEQELLNRMRRAYNYELYFNKNIKEYYYVNYNPRKK